MDFLTPFLICCLLVSFLISERLLLLTPLLSMMSFSFQHTCFTTTFKCIWFPVYWLRSVFLGSHVVWSFGESAVWHILKWCFIILITVLNVFLYTWCIIQKAMSPTENSQWVFSLLCLSYCITTIQFLTFCWLEEKIVQDNNDIFSLNITKCKAY